MELVNKEKKTVESAVHNGILDDERLDEERELQHEKQIFEDIDKKRAQEALDRAMERMRQKQSIQEYHHSQAAMARAMTRLKLSSKYLN